MAAAVCRISLGFVESRPMLTDRLRRVRKKKALDRVGDDGVLPRGASSAHDQQHE